MKKLAGLGNNLSAMVLGEGASGLFEELVDLPDGTVTIDLLTAQGRLNDVIDLKTPYIKELSNWFPGRVPACGVELKEISLASVEIHIDSSTVPTIRLNIVHYLADALTTIEARGRRYEQSSPVKHVWHKRST